MHKLTGKTRSAKRFYTLKKYDGDNEIYILSSDFGDREEDLSLKIKEILDISKRFFETGIHFYQGTVSEILMGEKKLDIVFGIKTAIALSEAFKEHALGFEKEVKNILIFEATLQQSQKEKVEYKKKLETQEEKQKTIDNDIKTKEDELNTFQSFKNSSETIYKSVESFENKKRTMEDAKLKESMITKEMEDTKAKFGTKEELKKNLKNPRDSLEKTVKETTRLEKESESFQDIIRNVEREKGDIEGILRRREETKDKPKCEFCGATIDPSKIVKEIKECKAKLKGLNDTIKINETNDQLVKDDVAKLRSEEKELNKQILELESEIKKIEDLEAKIKELRDEIQNAEVSYNDEKNILINNFQEVKDQLKTKLANLNSKREEDQKEFSKSLYLIVEDMEALKKEISLEKSVRIKDKLRELIISKISEISTTLEHLINQKKQYQSDIEETKNHIKRLDKEIANIEKQILELRRKEELAEKYRNYQQVFKDTQEIIRKNVSSVLEEKILKLHQFFSSDNEFEKVHIDSEDYSLSVTPKGMSMEDFYPAWVYEGGGHKLILGLSYKFSLGKIIGNAPFLLIDEPTEFMDEDNRINLLSNLSSTAEDTQIILITHQDVDKIQCDKKIELTK